VQTAGVALSECELVERAIAGDGDAFGELYRQHLNAIYRYVYYRVGEVKDAEDLTEQTFLKAWHALPGYRDCGHPFASWLYRIAQNLILDYHRKNKTDAAIARDLELDWQTVQANLLKQIIDAEEAGALAEAISRLTEDQQQVVLLRFVERLSHAEIARILDKSEGACRMLQNRALVTLAEILSGASG
jgi:RNA polymerase sigma-70 factor, ECF subfamily